MIGRYAVHRMKARAGIFGAGLVLLLGGLLAPAKAQTVLAEGFTLNFSNVVNDSAWASQISGLTSAVTFEVIQLGTGANATNWLWVSFDNTSEYTVKSMAFNTAPPVDLFRPEEAVQRGRSRRNGSGQREFEVYEDHVGLIKNIQGDNDSATVNRAGFGNFDWLVDFQPNLFLEPEHMYEFAIRIWDNPPPTELAPRLTDAADPNMQVYGALHFTRLDDGGSVWGGSNGKTPPVVPEGSSIAMLAGGALPFIGLARRRLRKQSS